jgi:hypothetical protein
MMTSNDNKQKIEEKVGEALGLEMAAQKAVEELGSKGLLDKKNRRPNYSAAPRLPPDEA